MSGTSRQMARYFQVVRVAAFMPDNFSPKAKMVSPSFILLQAAMAHGIAPVAVAGAAADGADLELVVVAGV